MIEMNLAFLKIFMKKEEDLIFQKIQAISKEEDFPPLSQGKGEYLFKLVLEHGPKLILEIGSGRGDLSLWMAAALSEEGSLIGVEINPFFVNQAQNLLRKANLQNKVKFIIGDALEILPTLKEKFDFVLIDALKEDYQEYLRQIEPNLNKKAVIVADNAGIFAQEMKAYLDYVRNSAKFESKFIPIDHDGLEVSILK